ncbi:hypothetical protein V7024_21170, partial [Bacillus sp. JJ864]|uniref:hypothetical protein n=1 Tax=Bacillus sp. JJ864 TaxID=3122975 RepID=UPI002FFE9021
MSELIHQTADILIPQILEEGILYKRRSEGIFDHSETDRLNTAIMLYRPDYIELDREKCVFFSFKRDYVRFGHKKNGIIVNSDDLEQDKLYVFSNSICGAIMRSIKNKSVDLKEHVDTYWKTM